jgi:hypothetical protein
VIYTCVYINIQYKITVNIHLKLKDRKVKTCPVWGRTAVGGRRVNGEGEYGSCTLNMCIEIEQ